MILWIAGYPRTGNTLTRLILKRCFGIESASLYREPKLTKLFPTFSGELVPKFMEWVPTLQRSQQLVGLKTHGIPARPDNSPAIYTVRDGRDACVSASHFWQLELPRVICEGGKDIANWSAHYHSWRPRDRPKTLTLRYEQTLADPPSAVAAIAQFLGIEPIAPWQDCFDECKALWPRMFGSHTGSWQQEMTGADLELFWRIHGEVMRELGYQ